MGWKPSLPPRHTPPGWVFIGDQLALSWCLSPVPPPLIFCVLGFFTLCWLWGTRPRPFLATPSRPLVYGVVFLSPKGLLVLRQEAQTVQPQTRSAAELWCGRLTPDSGPGPGVSWRLAGVRRGPGVPVWCGVVTVWGGVVPGREHQSVCRHLGGSAQLGGPAARRHQSSSAGWGMGCVLAH